MIKETGVKLKQKHIEQLIKANLQDPESIRYILEKIPGYEDFDKIIHNFRNEGQYYIQANKNKFNMSLEHSDNPGINEHTFKGVVQQFTYWDIQETEENEVCILFNP